MADYTPRSEHKLTFRLWTVGNIGCGPFGAPISPLEIARMQVEIGALGGREVAKSCK